MESLEKQFIKETNQLEKFWEWNRERKYFKLREDLNNKEVNK